MLELRAWLTTVVSKQQFHQQQKKLFPILLKFEKFTTTHVDTAVFMVVVDHENY